MVTSWHGIAFAAVPLPVDSLHRTPVALRFGDSLAASPNKLRWFATPRRPCYVSVAYPVGWKESKKGRQPVTWWRHQKETFSSLLAICEGNPTVTSGFPSQVQWRGALACFFICTNDWDAVDLRRHRAHYDVIVMIFENGGVGWGRGGGGGVTSPQRLF